MTIQIDKNVPVPMRGGNRKSKYPWADMEVGDSFFVSDKTVQNFAGTALHAKKARNIQLITRTVEENGVKGVRVWRVE